VAEFEENRTLVTVTAAVLTKMAPPNPAPPPPPVPPPFPPLAAQFAMVIFSIVTVPWLAKNPGYVVLPFMVIGVPLRYPIINTPVNFNLINSEQSPRLDRSALISLVKWMEKQRKKDEYFESHGVGIDSKREAPSINQFVGSNGSEENKLHEEGNN
jgi:hypothetical protein